jgi:hypothetical protein
MDLDKSFHELQRGGRETDRARGGELLHARGQVSGLADGRVVHTQVVADGADDNFAAV